MRTNRAIWGLLPCFYAEVIPTMHQREETTQTTIQCGSYSFSAVNPCLVVFPLVLFESLWGLQTAFSVRFRVGRLPFAIGWTFVVLHLTGLSASSGAQMLSPSGHGDVFGRGARRKEPHQEEREGPETRRKCVSHI